VLIEDKSKGEYVVEGRKDNKLQHEIELVGHDVNQNDKEMKEGSETNDKFDYNRDI